VVGEVSFIDGGPRSVSLVSLTECELLRMSIEDRLASVSQVLDQLRVGELNVLIS
jgi:CRP-like cAMP-binding protein